jgi:hypothetical protein
LERFSAGGHGAFGAITGFTLSATAAVRPIGDELILSSRRAVASAGRGGKQDRGRGAPFSVPLGVLLIGLSLLSFYAAALIYTVLGLLQESLTPTMIRVFGVVVGIVVLLTAVYAPGRIEVLAHGGNVVFLCLLIGWYLGDFFRPEGF